MLDTDSLENISNNTEQIKCKLQKVVIKEFDDDVLNWQTFWDQFESNIDKFSYLQSFLCSSTHETISLLALSNQNYLEAVGILKQRYRN